MTTTLRAILKVSAPVDVDSPPLDKETLAKCTFRSLCVIGIYFLFDGDDVVYVGQSVDMAGRMRTHMQDRDNGIKIWDSFSFIRCREDDLDVLEATYIGKFRPKYNAHKRRSRMWDK